MNRGARDEVKQELQKAIRCRRVAQGLDEMPSFEAKRPNNQVKTKNKYFTKQNIFLGSCYIFDVKVHGGFTFVILTRNIK